MTFPALLFGIILSTACGTAFHFWKDGSLKRLLLYIILAWSGFWIGNFAGGLLGWHFAVVGPINTGPAIVGCAVFLFAGDWLSHVQVEQK